MRNEECDFATGGKQDAGASVAPIAQTLFGARLLRAAFDPVAGAQAGAKDTHYRRRKTQDRTLRRYESSPRLPRRRENRLF